MADLGRNNQSAILQFLFDDLICDELAALEIACNLRGNLEHDFILFLAEPDAIFFGGMDPQAGPMLRQMEQLGLTKQKYFGGDGICTNDLIKQSAGAKTLENVICAEGGSSLAKMPSGDAWMKRYEA